MVEAALADWRTAPIREPLRAALGLLHAVNQAPASVPVEALGACRAAGLDAEAIEDVAGIGFHFEFINRVADALDFERPDERQRPRVAALLDRAGNVFGGARPEPSWREGEDGVLLPVELEEARRGMLGGDGFLSASMRQGIEGYVARARGGARSVGEVPESLSGFLDRLALHAYRIVDEDVEALKEAGFDEDQILEIVLIGSLGAAVVGLESVFRGLWSGAEPVDEVERGVVRAAG